MSGVVLYEEWCKGSSNRSQRYNCRRTKGFHQLRSDSRARTLVEEAFEDAKKDFENDSVADPRKLELTRSNTRFEDVQAAVLRTRVAYESEERIAKCASGWNASLSEYTCTVVYWMCLRNIIRNM
jgi:hypothetical protein